MTPETQALLLWLVPLLLATGLLAGLLAGLLGVGGGIVVVPVLYYVFSYLGLDEAVRMHLAVGTSLATIVPTSIRSMRAHQARGSFDASIFRAWMPGVLIGVVAGTWAATLADFNSLVSVFATVALLVSLHMAFGRRDWRLATTVPTGLYAYPVTFVIGGFSAMMGIGGGTLSVPALSLLGMPIHRAVGTAAGFGLVISIPASIGFVIGGWQASGLPVGSLGYVNMLGFVLIVSATVFTAPLGARLAHSLRPEPLRRAFALFLALTAFRMLSDIF